MSKFYEVNEVFEMNGKQYKVVEDLPCKECDLGRKCCDDLECGNEVRKDGYNVGYKEYLGPTDEDSRPDPKATVATKTDQLVAENRELKARCERYERIFDLITGGK